jgi:hypothetical protein
MSQIHYQNIFKDLVTINSLWNNFYVFIATRYKIKVMLIFFAYIILINIILLGSI